MAFIASNRLLAEIKIGYFTLARILSNFAQFSDSLFKSFGKSISDQANASEQFQRQVEYRRIYENESAAVESISKDVGLRVGDDTDQDYVEDGYFFEDYVTGPSTEIMAVADLAYLIIGKSKNEPLGVDDNFSIEVDYSRSFDDQIIATDDLDGEASIEDDQEVQFFKVRKDFAFPADQAARSIGSGKTDQASASDSNVINLDKYRADHGSTTDQTDIAISKQTEDFSVVSDALVLAFQARRSDGMQTSDQAIKLSGIVRSESASSADSGSLISQGYVDNLDYFAEDYVGASRTF